MIEAILLIGIPGSGKSTFYQTFFTGTHIRINLDTLKTRSREEVVLRSCLASRASFVVDNTNVSIRERARYIRLAREAGYRVIGYYFPTSLQAALERNHQRSGKQRVPTGGVAARLRQLEPPGLEEGFDRLYIVHITEKGGFQVQEAGPVVS